jgi:hypothetical protein
MLTHGQFEDEYGTRYHVPLRTDRELTPEREIIEAARRIARSKNLKVIRVWGWYETKREIRL